MKISNIKNLEKAIKNKENEIEVNGEISDTVLKSGMVSTIIFFGAVLFTASILVAIAFGILYLIFSTQILISIAIISLCITIFSITITLTITAIQKASIPLALKLHKYRVTKKNNRIVLIKK